MNMNSLVIAADSARARIFRTGHPNDPTAPPELIDVDTLTAAESGDGTSSEARLFARRIAARAAGFAHDHFCNPVILTATRSMKDLLLSELELALPRAYIRPITVDPSNLDARELMRTLEKQEAFTPKQYPAHV